MTLTAPATSLPQRAPPLALGVALSLVGAPLAWFIEICAGYALASAPCFEPLERIPTIAAAAPWTMSALLGVCAASTAIAFLGSSLCYRMLQRTQRESEDSLSRARTRFLARWGMLIGTAFAIASILVVPAYALLPRCAG